MNTTMKANNVELIGKLGMNPEVKATSTGKKVARFTLAHLAFSKKSNAADENKKPASVNWFNLVAWEDQADVAEQYLFKGRKVHVKGRLISRNWTDKSGQKRTTTEIVVNDIVMMDDPMAA
jgi:single-strand DNA-binding protein